MLSYKVNLKIEVMNFLINWMLNYVQWFEYIRMYSTFWLVFINQIIKNMKEYKDKTIWLDKQKNVHLCIQ